MSDNRLPHPESVKNMHLILDLQRKSLLADGPQTVEKRIDRLDRLLDMLLSYEARIIEAEQVDFHNKSPILIRLAEILGPTSAIRYIRENIREWAKPTPIELPPAHAQIGVRAEIQYQPLGVVGVISPWNGPIILSCLPLAGILAAGNRAMIKMSEFTPTTAALFQEMISKFFDESEVAVFTGGPDVAAMFTQLSFDHLLYTGSTRVAKLVMKAAAENLVPVTLELGGKSPVILGNSIDISVAAKRIAYGKVIHAGQVCVTPDYILAPHDQINAFVDGIERAITEMYPSIISNEDYAPVLNQDRFRRLEEMVRDAEEKGGRVIVVNSGNEKTSSTNNLQFPLHLILNPTDDMHVMTEEIFGPILPIKGYSTLAEAISYIQSKPKPLAAYYFGKDEKELRKVQENVSAGSMVVNDVLCQIFYEQLPFGGVGPSGMGRYRGKDGFKTFSNQMTVLIQTEMDEILQSMRPPYGEAINMFIEQQVRPTQI